MYRHAMVFGERESEAGTEEGERRERRLFRVHNLVNYLNESTSEIVVWLAGLASGTSGAYGMVRQHQINYLAAFVSSLRKRNCFPSPFHPRLQTVYLYLPNVTQRVNYIQPPSNSSPSPNTALTFPLNPSSTKVF